MLERKDGRERTKQTAQDLAKGFTTPFPGWSNEQEKYAQLLAVYCMLERKDFGVKELQTNITFALICLYVGMRWSFKNYRLNAVKNASVCKSEVLV